jgi:hypothetical protein
VHANEVIVELRNSTQLSLQGLEAAWNVKTGVRKPSRGEIANLFETYLNDAAAITSYIDTLKVQ